MHARAIGGPTFLELVPAGEETNAPKAAVQKYSEEPVDRHIPEPDRAKMGDLAETEGLDLDRRVYPLHFLVRYKFAAPQLEDGNMIKGLKVLAIYFGFSYRVTWQHIID